MVAGPDGVRLDEQRRLPGRGAYVCSDPSCVEVARRRGARVVRKALRAGDEYEVMHEVVSVLSQMDHQDVAPKERGA